MEVALIAYELGVNNKYSTPEELFIGGLYHDIYRPTRGTGGTEDQTKGAKVVTKIFNKMKVSNTLTTRVCNMIKSHDSWRGKKNPPRFDLLISIADKASHDSSLIYSYMWSSNKELEKQGKPAIYTNHLITCYHFIRYQVRAWEIFYNYNDQVKGVDKAISSYLALIKIVTDNLSKDPDNLKFDEILIGEVNKYAKKELLYLKRFTKSQREVEQILNKGVELLN